MVKTLAIHGDFATGPMLRRDTGIDAWEYPPWKLLLRGSLLWSRIKEPLVLVGYSGASRVIRDIDMHGAVIKAAVLYEPAPIDGFITDFPVLFIENHNGRGSKSLHWRKVMDATFNSVAQHNPTTHLMGSGRHIEFTWGFPPFRHGWDRSLNTTILEFIDEQTSV